MYDFLTPHTHEPLLLLLADLVAPVGLCEIVFESLPDYQPNLYVFPLFTGFFHPSCTEDHQVSDVDDFPSWDWGVSGFYELHSLFNLFKKVHHWV